MSDLMSDDAWDKCEVDGCDNCHCDECEFHHCAKANGDA